MISFGAARWEHANGEPRGLRMRSGVEDWDVALKRLVSQTALLYDMIEMANPIPFPKIPLYCFVLVSFSCCYGC